MNEEDSQDTSCRANHRRLFALILLGVALLALAERHFGPGWNRYMLVAVGAAFVVWSLVSRVWGLLIPGCVILGVGGGILIHKAFGLGGTGKGGVFLICMAAGWFLLTLLSAVGFRKRVLWPMIPGGVLALIGAIQLSGSDARAYFSLLNDYWPIAAIVVAVWILFTSARGGTGR